MLNLIWENLWNILMMFIGLISIILSFSIFIAQKNLKRNGLLTEAKLIRFSNEKGVGESSSPLKIPVFTFWHKDEKGSNYYIVKGKTNATGKLGEITPIYYNPENPKKEYYLPEKDFLMKYVLFFLGAFFFCLGVLYLTGDLNTIDNIYFLYLFLSLFIGAFLLYLFGKYSTNRS